MLDLLDKIRRKRADHPLYSVEAAQKLLAALPADAGQALAEIASWLESVGRTEGFHLDDRIGVIKLLDETAQKREAAALSAFLRDPGLKEYGRLQLWQVLAGFWEHLAAAYRVCLAEIPERAAADAAMHPECPIVVLRGLRALANEAKMLHLRYLPVTPRLWQELAELYARSEKEGFAAKPFRAYAADALPTTARQEFLRELMLDASLPESELPQEIELAARVIARLGGGFLLHPEPGEGCNLCFDFAHPGRPFHPEPGTPVGSGARFFGPGIVETAIREIIERHTAHPEEPEKRFGDDYAIEEKLLVLKHLLRYWGKTPPRRRTMRVKLDAPVRVAHGFTSASQLVPRIEFSGMAEVTENLRMKMKQDTGLALEAAGGTTPVTEWTERDAATWGIGVDVPWQDESWARIGALCALQPAGLKGWWLGVIRRLHRDAKNRLHAGVEILAKKPLSVYFRGLGEGAQRADNWASSSGSFQFTYLNALLLGESATPARQEALLPHGVFTPGLLYEAMIGEKTPHVRLEELLERGADCDRVRVSWLKAAG